MAEANITRSPRPVQHDRRLTTHWTPEPAFPQKGDPR
jgi:hypothetical protein